MTRKSLRKSLVPIAPRVAFAAIALVLVGCYGSAPKPPPRIPLPEIVPGQEIVVTSETTTNIETVRRKSWTCPQGHVEGSAACTYTILPVVEPVTRTTTTATYGGVELTDAQIRVMADDEHEDKRVRLDALRASCSSANTPRYVGLASVLGGLVLWGIAAGTQEAAFTYAGFGAFGLGAGAYSYGYFAAGGSNCREAHNLAAELSGTRFHHDKSRADEIRELAARFNARSRTDGEDIGSATEPRDSEAPAAPQRPRGRQATQRMR